MSASPQAKSKVLKAQSLHSVLRSFVRSFLPSFVPSFLPQSEVRRNGETVKEKEKEKERERVSSSTACHSFLPSFVPLSLRSFVHSFVRSEVPKCVRSLQSSFTSFQSSFVHFAPKFVCSFTSFQSSFVRSFVRRFIFVEKQRSSLYTEYVVGSTEDSSEHTFVVVVSSLSLSLSCRRRWAVVASLSFVVCRSSLRCRCRRHCRCRRSIKASSLSMFLSLPLIPLSLRGCRRNFARRGCCGSHLQTTSPFCCQALLQHRCRSCPHQRCHQSRPLP